MKALVLGLVGRSSSCEVEGWRECFGDGCTEGYSSSREVALDAALIAEETELRRREYGDESTETVEVGDHGSLGGWGWSVERLWMAAV